MKEIYLDNCMASKPSKRAISDMMPYLTDKWASPYAPHKYGERSQRGIQEGLTCLYTVLNASPKDEVIFTSSGAEAVNQAVFSTYFNYTLESGKNHFLAGSIDDAPAIMALNRLKELSCNYKLIQPNHRGFITEEAVLGALSPRTALVSLSLASGMTGVVNPIAEIAEALKERAVWLHVDASYAIGKVDVDFSSPGIHFLSFGGDALHAPLGSGALFIKEGVKAHPFIQGGVEQGHLRGGSFSVANLMALASACKEADEAKMYLATETARLRDLFEDLILEEIKEAVVFFRDEERLPNVTAIAFPGIAAEAFLYKLSENGVYASIGGGGMQQLSLILAGCSVPTPLCQSAISFSLSKEITEEDIKEASKRIGKAFREYQPLSTRILDGI